MRCLVTDRWIKFNTGRLNQMNPLVGGLLSMGGSLVSGMFSSDNSAKSLQAQEQMQMQSEQFNAQQAQMNRDFQQQMSSTAYQRAAADMKAAGLNPILAAGQSSSTPSGSSASVGTPSVPQRHAFEDLGNAVSQAVNTAIASKTIDKLQEEIANVKAGTTLREAETSNVSQQTETEKEETLRRMYEKRKAQLDIAPKAWSAKKAAALTGLDDSTVTAAERAMYGADVADRVGGAIGSVISSALGVKRLMPRRSTVERTDSRTGDQTFEERWSNH